MSSLETKPAPADSEGPAALAPDATRDIRFSQPYLLVRSPVRAFVRRLASIATLVLIDLAGLAFGIYAALVLRDLYRGNSPPLWGVLWRQVTDWLPFLAVVMVLFIVARLVARPKRTKAQRRTGNRRRPAVDLVMADPLVEIGPVHPPARTEENP